MLTSSAFDAILGLAASSHGPAPPSKPPCRDAPLPGAVRVAIWDERRGVKLSGKQAPTADELPAFLAANPRCSVYAGQTTPPSNAALDRLPVAPENGESFKPSTPPTPSSPVKRPATDEASSSRPSSPPAKRACRTASTAASSTPPAYVPATQAAQRAAWQNGGAVKVVEAMRAQPSCAQTQADGCGALAFLAAGAADHKRRVCAAGGAVATTRAMETHGACCLGVALQGCGALAVLVLDEESRVAVREAGGAAAVVRAMRLHSGVAQLQLLGCTALAALAEMRKLPAEPLAAAVLAAMRAFPADAALQAQGCRALLQLAAGAAQRRRVVCEAGGADAAAGAMLAHPTDAQVQQWGCGALTALAEGDGACVAAVRGAAGVGGARAIVEALARQPGHPHVAQLGLAALAAIVGSGGGPGAVGGGGGGGAAWRDVLGCGGAAAATRAMARHRDQWLVQLQGCALLALLAGCADEGAAAVRAAGGAAAALDALRRHATLPEVVRWGGRVLRALPHPLAPPEAVASAARCAHRLRLSRALLGSWGVGADAAAAAADDDDAKLPLDLIGKIAALALTHEAC